MVSGLMPQFCVQPANVRRRPSVTHLGATTKEIWCAGSVSAIKAGWVLSVIVQGVRQQQTPISAKLQAWMNLVQDVENVRSVGPAYATTQISLKDPTASMTRPSVKDMEVSSAMTAAPVLWVGVHALRAGQAMPVNVPQATRPVWTARGLSAVGEVNVCAAGVNVQTLA